MISQSEAAKKIPGEDLATGSAFPEGCTRIPFMRRPSKPIGFGPPAAGSAGRTSFHFDQLLAPEADVGEALFPGDDDWPVDASEPLAAGGTYLAHDPSREWGKHCRNLIVKSRNRLPQIRCEITRKRMQAGEDAVEPAVGVYVPVLINSQIGGGEKLPAGTFMSWSHNPATNMIDIVQPASDVMNMWEFYLGSGSTVRDLIAAVQNATGIPDTLLKIELAKQRQRLRIVCEDVTSILLGPGDAHPVIYDYHWRNKRSHTPLVRGSRVSTSSRGSAVMDLSHSHAMQVKGSDDQPARFSVEVITSKRSQSSHGPPRSSGSLRSVGPSVHRWDFGVPLAGSPLTSPTAGVWRDVPTNDAAIPGQTALGTGSMEKPAEEPQASISGASAACVFGMSASGPASLAASSAAAASAACVFGKSASGPASLAASSAACGSGLDASGPAFLRAASGAGDSDACASGQSALPTGAIFGSTAPKDSGADTGSAHAAAAACISGPGQSMAPSAARPTGDVPMYLPPSDVSFYETQDITDPYVESLGITKGVVAINIVVPSIRYNLSGGIVVRRDLILMGSKPALPKLGALGVAVNPDTRVKAVDVFESLRSKDDTYVKVFGWGTIVSQLNHSDGSDPKLGLPNVEFSMDGPHMGFKSDIIALEELQPGRQVWVDYNAPGRSPRYDLAKHKKEGRLHGAFALEARWTSSAYTTRVLSHRPLIAATAESLPWSPRQNNIRQRIGEVTFALRPLLTTPLRSHCASLRGYEPGNYPPIKTEEGTRIRARYGQESELRLLVVVNGEAEADDIASIIGYTFFVRNAKHLPYESNGEPVTLLLDVAVREDMRHYGLAGEMLRWVVGWCATENRLEEIASRRVFVHKASSTMQRAITRVAGDGACVPLGAKLTVEHEGREPYILQDQEIMIGDWALPKWKVGTTELDKSGAPGKSGASSPEGMEVER